MTHDELLLYCQMVTSPSLAPLLRNIQLKRSLYKQIHFTFVHACKKVTLDSDIYVLGNRWSNVLGT